MSEEFVPPREDLGSKIVTPLDFSLRIVEFGVEPDVSQGVIEVESSGAEGAGEESPLYEVIAFDPGGTTGWFIATIYPEAMLDPELKLLNHIFSWSAGEFTGPRRGQWAEMISLVMAWSDSADVVMEDFILRQFATRRELLEPVRVTFGFEARLDLHWPGRELILQAPDMAMATVTDDRLKAAGLYAPLAGKPHARDAARHGLTWARRRKADMEAERRRAARAAYREQERKEGA